MAAKRPAPVSGDTPDAGLFSELGKSGLNQYSGRIIEDIDKNLQGSKGRKIYREMREGDAVQGATMFALESLMRNVSRRVEAGGDTPEDLLARDLVASALDDMSFTWSDTLTEILSCFTYGWSFLEVVYKRRNGDSGETPSKHDDGLLGWRKWASRAQDCLEKWDFDETGGVSAIVQRPAPTYQLITIPMERGLLFRTSVRKNSPEGFSLQRNAYQPYYFKKRIMVVEGIGVARDLAGMPVMYVPPAIANATSGAEATARTEVKKVVTRIHRDEQEGLVLPSVFDANGNRLWDFKLVSSGGARQFNTSEIIQRYEIRQAMTTLMDFLFIGHQQTGTLGLHIDKTRLHALAVGGLMDAILEVVNRFAIPRLLRVNGMRLANPPRVVRGAIEEPNLAQIGDFILKLTGAGAPLFPDPALENQLREMAHLPGIEGMEVGKRGLPAAVAESGADLLAEIRKMQRTSAPIGTPSEEADAA